MQYVGVGRETIQMKIARLLPLALAAASLGGCGASLPSLTTGSLFGSKTAAAPATPAVVQNDPVSRALDVAGTSARAIKCGYNFDPAKLRNQYLASETAANPTATANIDKIYDTAFNGVSKAIAAKGADYCSELKVARIKLALTRHLGGDYTPAPPEPVEDDGGLLSGFGSNNSGDSDGVNSKGVFEN